MPPLLLIVLWIVLAVMIVACAVQSLRAPTPSDSERSHPPRRP